MRVESGMQRWLNAGLAAGVVVLATLSACIEPHKPAQQPDKHSTQPSKLTPDGTNPANAADNSNPDTPPPDKPAPAGVSILDAKAQIQAIPLAWDLSRDGSSLS